MIYAILGASLLLWIGPFYILFAVSLNADIVRNPPELLPSQPSVAGYETYLSNPLLTQWVLNSFAYSAAITIGCVLLSLFAGYAFSKLQFRGKTILFWLVLIAMMIPTVIYYIPLYITMARIGLINTYAGVILPLVVNPFSVFLVKQAFDAVPRDFEEAAVVDGASPYQTMLSVMFPLIRPVIITILLFNFVWSWNNWIWPMFVISSSQLDNLPVSLVEQVFSLSIIFRNVGAGAMICVIVPLIIYIIALDYFMKGVIVTGLKG